MAPTTSLNNGKIIVNQISFRVIEVSTPMMEPIGTIDLLNSAGSRTAYLPYLGDPCRTDLRETAKALDGQTITLKPEIAKGLGHPEVTIKFWQHVKA